MQTRDVDSLKLAALRMQIKAGVEQLERGEFAEIADADLERYLQRLTAAANKRRRRAIVSE